MVSFRSDRGLQVSLLVPGLPQNLDAGSAVDVLQNRQVGFQLLLLLFKLDNGVFQIGTWFAGFPVGPWPAAEPRRGLGGRCASESSGRLPVAASLVQA